MDIERLLTVSQAAEVIGCTPGRVRQLILAGTLEATKLSPRIMLVQKKDAEKIARNPANVGRPRINSRRV